MNFIFLGWFLIKASGFDANVNQYNYLLVDPVRNYYVSVSLEEPLKYKDGEWIKIRSEVECLAVSQPHDIIDVNGYFCNARSFKEAEINKPTLLNGAIFY